MSYGGGGEGGEGSSESVKEVFEGGPFGGLPVPGSAHEEVHRVGTVVRPVHTVTLFNPPQHV